MLVMKYHSRLTYSRGLHFERDVEIWDECCYNYILSFNVLNKKLSYKCYIQYSVDCYQISEY